MTMTTARSSVGIHQPPGTNPQPPSWRMHKLHLHHLNTMWAPQWSTTTCTQHCSNTMTSSTTEEPRQSPITVIEPLMDELAIPDDGCGDRENEVEEGMGYTLQGEYTPANYSPTPAPPPPAPVHPPPPPTLSCTLPRPYYKLSQAWLKPPQTRYTPQRPPFCPNTHPQHERHPHRENQTSHVPAT